jgi:hypothetical protein
METKVISIMTGLLLCITVLNGQVIKGEKIFLEINTGTGNVSMDDQDPLITIISPVLTSESVYNTNKPDVPLFGNTSGNAGIDFVVLNSEYLSVTDEGQFNQRLTLFPGKNSFALGAMDVNRNYSEKRFEIIYTPIKVPLAEKVRNESTYYALIIGINHYSDPDLSTLENPISDAQALYDVLSTHYTFDKNNIQFLRDAKREEIIYALDELSRRVTPDDNLLIYYTGHGQYDENANIGYWLPSNARRLSTADWFGNSQLVDFIKRIESKHTLLIADACFSGSIFKTKSAFSDVPAAVEKLYELPSRKAMTSGTLTEVPDKSPFAKYLVERLTKNEDQYYSAEQLFSSLRIAVINNSDAIPQYGEIRNVGDQGGDFIFIRK